MSIQFKLNGSTRTIEPRSGESLLHALRDQCDIRSTKDGCEPQGQCGCCLALIDGNPKVTCAVPAEKAAGKEILTLEGVSEQERDLFSRAFVAAAGMQCGFCIPGILLRAKHLVDQNPTPSRQDIAKAIDVHLCRCTGYVKIIDAVELMARAKRGEPIPEPQEDGRVGQSLQRVAGLTMALGDRPYVDDLTRPGLLHGAVVMSPHARARVKRARCYAERAVRFTRLATSRGGLAGDRDGRTWASCRGSSSISRTSAS